MHANMPSAMQHSPHECDRSKHPFGQVNGQGGVSMGWKKFGGVSTVLEAKRLL